MPKHTHKYYRATLAIGEVWACALPDCNHHMPEHYAGLMNGKRSICWNCNQPFILNPNSLTQKTPVCDACTLGESNAEMPSDMRERRAV